MSDNNERYAIANPMETLFTVLGSVGISLEYNPADESTDMFYADKKVGTVFTSKDIFTSRDKIFAKTADAEVISIETLKDIDEFKELLMNKYNIPDTEGLEIIVQYRSDDTKRLAAIKKGDWIDMYADEDVSIKKGELKLVHLGVAMKLPEGYEGHLAPRSSTLKNFHVLQANSVGVIDQSYCGPNDWWRFPAYAVEDTEIKRGEKICQFRIMEKQPKIRFTEGVMVAEDRGGFGSTGTR